MSEKHLAMIMATGRSKRTPLKNLADVCGRPVVSYVIEICQASSVYEDIVVSTDSEEIATASKEWGASVFFRPLEWIGKNYLDTLILGSEQYQEETDQRFSYLTHIFGTAIFWRPSWLRRADKILRQGIQGGSRVCTVEANCPMCVSISLNPYASISPREPMPHIGINIDIDYPHELECARQIMTQIQEGEIHYPLEETVHEKIAILSDDSGRAE